MDPFGNNFFKLNSMWQDTWKFPWTLSVTNFSISLDVTGYTDLFIDPFRKEFVS